MTRADPPTIVIRDAEPADAGGLSRLLAEPGFDYPTPAEIVAQRFADLTMAGDRILVADLSSTVIGLVLLHRTHFLHRPPDGRVSSLVVDEEHRNGSVGTRLVEAAESVFRDWGCGRIEVSSGVKRTGAHRFYLRLGFVEQPKRFTKILTETRG